ncbi:hypothetical protein [Clostridium kluyveri]|uniref:Uncharacterized protein n=1 Tax=Clostridium kluyveri TaxID=1534 RepID=A0A1L5FCT9_CLOKL|nr:hypothetical protein [Clostridium kluyveri]APM40828.1 hypothetical protein BS101_20005 [Clostridium kluyveri]
MIRRLIKLNLKGTNNKIHILILIISSIMITFMNLGILAIPHEGYLCMGDILIQTFGGLTSDFDLTKDIMSFILWAIPNVLVIYLIDICVMHKLRESTILVLPKVKSKLKWLIAFDSTIAIVVIKYYLILVFSSLLIIFMKMNFNAFRNCNVIMNNFNSLNVSLNQYLVLVYIIILNILTIISVLFFMNNLYYIFFNSNEASIIGLLFCIVSVNITKLDLLNKFTLMNHGMLRRHDMFKLGFKGFNIGNSIFYLITFLTINFIIGILIIKKRDLNNI